MKERCFGYAQHDKMKKYSELSSTIRVVIPAFVLNETEGEVEGSLKKNKEMFRLHST